MGRGWGLGGVSRGGGGGGGTPVAGSRTGAAPGFGGGLRRARRQRRGMAAGCVLLEAWATPSRQARLGAALHAGRSAAAMSGLSPRASARGAPAPRQCAARRACRWAAIASERSERAIASEAVRPSEQRERTTQNQTTRTNNRWNNTLIPEITMRIYFTMGPPRRKMTRCRLKCGRVTGDVGLPKARMLRKPGCCLMSDFWLGISILWGPKRTPFARGKRNDEMPVCRKK